MDPQLVENLGTVNLLTLVVAWVLIAASHRQWWIWVIPILTLLTALFRIRLIMFSSSTPREEISLFIDEYGFFFEFATIPLAILTLCYGIWCFITFRKNPERQLEDEIGAEE